MERSTNALAELAEDLEILKVILKSEHHPKGVQVADKAQRIVAEIAKVEFLTCDGAVIGTVLTQADRAIIKSRKIAEEGAGDATVG